jgi:hypothetical protein
MAEKIPCHAVDDDEGPGLAGGLGLAVLGDETGADGCGLRRHRCAPLTLELFPVRGFRRDLAAREVQHDLLYRYLRHAQRGRVVEFAY